MAITLPIPGIGDVIVLTREGEVVTSNCPSTFNPPPEKTFNVQTGYLYRISCNPVVGGGPIVTYILNADELNFFDLFQTITNLSVISDSGALVNTFIATAS